jgi:hypothetical protein
MNTTAGRGIAKTFLMVLTILIAQSGLATLAMAGGGSPPPPPPAPPPPANDVITGKVLNASGQPAAGVKAYASDLDSPWVYGFTGTTAADGSFTINIPVSNCVNGNVNYCGSGLYGRWYVSSSLAGSGTYTTATVIFYASNQSATVSCIPGKCTVGSVAVTPPPPPPPPPVSGCKPNGQVMGTGTCCSGTYHSRYTGRNCLETDICGPGNDYYASGC